MEESQEHTTLPDPSEVNQQKAEWQKSLLPLMKRMLIGLALFFFIATFAQLIYLHLKIEAQSGLDLSDSFSILDPESAQDFEQQMEAVHLRSMVALEAESLQRRHHQANVLLMSRVWARYLGFITGMILAFVGGVFILGKLETPSSEIEGKTAGAGFSFKSSSPGLILAALGVFLMFTTITTHHEIKVTDVKVYTTSELNSTAQTDDKGDQPTVPDEAPY